MKYNDLNYVDMEIAVKKTKIDSEFEEKNGGKWLLGFGHFFWAGVLFTISDDNIFKLSSLEWRILS